MSINLTSVSFLKRNVCNCALHLLNKLPHAMYPRSNFMVDIDKSTRELFKIINHLYNLQVVDLLHETESRRLSNNLPLVTLICDFDLCFSFGIHGVDGLSTRQWCLVNIQRISKSQKAPRHRLFVWRCHGSSCDTLETHLLILQVFKGLPFS